LFVRDGTLTAQTFDVTRLELSGDPFPIAEQVVSDPIFGNGMFSTSANGVLVYRAGGESGHTQLTWFDRAGKRLGTVGPPGEYLNPLFSPDGQQVVFERRSAQGDRDVWLLELSRGTTTRFTFNPSDDQQPVWSPDGSRIVFASNRDKSYGIYQKPSNGTGNEELLFRADGDVAPMSWSQDGRVLLFRRINENGFNEVWVLPLTGERKPFPYLQSEDFAHSAARLSPDGHWVAYYSLESGRLEAYLQTFLTVTGKWRVSTTGGIQPTWSRDGRELFYLGPDQKLMAVSLKPGTTTPELGTPQPLFEAPVLGGYRVLLGFRQQYEVASDGQRVLVNVPAGEEPGAPLTVVLNWDAALKRVVPRN
jgi:dipeptidyl aminopeptidase/acylaminoacyl peptidase